MRCWTSRASLARGSFVAIVVVGALVSLSGPILVSLSMVRSMVSGLSFICVCVCVLKWWVSFRMSSQPHGYTVVGTLCLRPGRRSGIDPCAVSPWKHFCAFNTAGKSALLFSQFFTTTSTFTSLSSYWIILDLSNWSGSEDTSGESRRTGGGSH